MINPGEVALQLHTVRDRTQKDFAATLHHVAALGYKGVEFAGYGQHSATDLKALLTDTGLQAVGSHVLLSDLTEETLNSTLTACQTIGCPALVLAWIAPEWRELEHLPTFAQSLNQIGQRCLDRGITFGYHNHEFEFQLDAGRLWLDHFVQATDPHLVKLELDVYWAAHAGCDPLTLLERLRERIILVHVKDMAADRSMTEVGQGALNIPEIVGFAQRQGIWSVVEHDEPTLPSLESARISLEYLRQMQEKERSV